MKKITMVKKRLPSGQACQKCEQAEAMLKNRNLWQLVDQVLWADERDPHSEGNRLAQLHGIQLAPFFIIEGDAEPKLFTSALGFARELSGLTAAQAPKAESVAYELPEDGLEAAPPRNVVEHALRAFGAKCAIAFSGAEDVVLIDMAVKSGLPFSVFSIDTGRLHPETYRFVERVRNYYAIDILVVSPERAPVEALVRQKGLFSFYEEGHQECCEVRKVSSLRRALTDYAAWMTGQRRDQSPTRSDLQVVMWDTAQGRKPGQLCKFNPLAAWSLAETWDYIRANDVPTNELHERGYISIGCEPCTRAIRPGEHERAGRWWWEEATKRECGLHVSHTPNQGSGI
jgi:phosphoadenosine phosphosulfate reductase